jgi:hypothetical protein
MSDNDYCEACCRDADECDCDPLPRFAAEAESILAQLDNLAEVWGDEGVFRRCRDRLRALADKMKGWPS